MTTTLESPVPASDETVEAAPPRRFTRRTWDRFGFGVLLIATLVTYLWDITVNGMGNQFYAGAAQAGSRNWEALLFGSLDTQNYITVDEPPVSQWVMGLSGQILGFSSASMLVPEALMAVATVALLYGAVRRISGPNAALLAGAAFALTPVAALMFPYNNPDAVMVLLVMPAIGLVYLVAAPTSVRKRLLHLLGSLVAFGVSAGWYVVLTLLWPTSGRGWPPTSRRRRWGTAPCTTSPRR